MATVEADLGIIQHSWTHFLATIVPRLNHNNQVLYLKRQLWVMDHQHRGTHTKKQSSVVKLLGRIYIEPVYGGVYGGQIHEPRYGAWASLYLWNNITNTIKPDRRETQSQLRSIFTSANNHIWSLRSQCIIYMKKQYNWINAMRNRRQMLEPYGWNLMPFHIGSGLARSVFC